jgi:GxxExxY protein
MLTKDHEPDISKIIVDCAFKVHKSLGAGLLENAYEACLFHEIIKRGLNVKRQIILPIRYDGIDVESGYRLDLLVENKLIIELKAVDKLLPIHQAQLLTYLKLSSIKTGLLINFNVNLIKDGIKRLSL